MSLLTENEKAQSARDVRQLILAADTEAAVTRCVPGENLFGHEDETFAPIGTIAIELNRTPPPQLQATVDAVASILPEVDVKEEDRLEVPGEAYRVQTIVEESLFGIVTHRTLQLVRIHGSQTNG